ncbi:MAG: tetratricopeptide repeat protein, partial [Planctomycetota bacterium]
MICRSGSDEDQQAQVTYEKFLAVLEKNARPGRALDQVIEYHSDRGTFDEFIEQRRKDVTADKTSWLIIGLLESHRQHHMEAVAAFEQAEVQQPDDAVPCWMLGRSLAELDRHADAAVALERAVTRNPDRVSLMQIFQDLGRAYRRAHRPDKASEVWGRMETKFPGDIRVREQIARTLLDEGDFENCLRRYEELATLQKDPSQAAQSRLIVGDLQMTLGQTEAARATFEDVLMRLDSDSWLYRDARRRIEDLFARQDSPDALIAYYVQWLKDHPEDLDAMVRLARSLAGQFRYEEARHWYGTAIEKAPSRVDLRQAMIQQWLREDNMIAAIDEYHRLADLDSGNADHLEAWGLLCLKRTDQPEDQRQAAAKDVWLKLLQGFESDAARHLRVADLLRRAELPADALEYYQKAAELSKGDPPVVESLARCLIEMNRRDEAIATLRQIAVGSRRSTANLLQLAASLQTVGEPEMALQATREACELSPSFQDRLLLVRRLRDFRRDGQHPYVAESLEQLAKVDALVESDDDRRLVRDERILCLTSAGQMESQIEALARSSAERDDVSVDEWTTLASYYAAIDRRSEASEAIRKALAVHADHVEALSLAAELYEETGRLKDAADVRRRLKTLDRRRQSEHLSKLVILELRLNQKDAAFATAKELLNTTPGNPDAVNLYADLCFQSSRPDEGLNALRRLVRSNPSDQAARFRLAEVLTQLQRTTEAEAVWWRTLLAVEDRLLQDQIVASLADLAVRNERLDVLLKQLEQRGRELNRRSDAARWRAAAFQKVEDFAAARESLESVLTEDARDIEILQRLSSLCEMTGDLNAAIEFQRRIEAVAPSNDGKLRLTTLLIQSGELTEADALLARVAKFSGSSLEVIKAIDQLTETQELDAAGQVCER